MTTSKLNLFATTPKGLELLLVDELRALGAEDAAEKLAGVVFSGDLELAYKACLWSRLANRVLLRLAQVPASTPEELYEGVKTHLLGRASQTNRHLKCQFRKLTFEYHPHPFWCSKSKRRDSRSNTRKI